MIEYKFIKVYKILDYVLLVSTLCNFILKAQIQNIKWKVC